MIAGLLGLLGATGTGLALAPALQVLTYPFLILTVVTLGRGWYLQLQAHGWTLWRQRAPIVLMASTVLSITLWSLRFGGLLGALPF